MHAIIQHVIIVDNSPGSFTTCAVCLQKIHHSIPITYVQHLLGSRRSQLSHATKRSMNNKNFRRSATAPNVGIVYACRGIPNHNNNYTPVKLHTSRKLTIPFQQLCSLSVSVRPFKLEIAQTSRL